jgi:hypothetical protein
MRMTRQVFDGIFTTAAEVIGKTVTERTFAMYWGALQNAESQDIKDAFDAYTSKGKWPTINELLSECRMKPRMTRAEREFASKPEKTHMADSDVEAWYAAIKGHGGNLAWPVTIVTESRQRAESEMLEVVKKLQEHGWNITGRSEMLEGLTSPEGKASGRKFYRVFYYAEKHASETAKIHSTDDDDVGF